MAFKVCSKGNCGISVIDLNEENYQEQPILTVTGSIYYTFEQSASVNVLTSVAHSGEKTIQDSEITTHSLSVNDATGVATYVTDESVFEFPIDGLFEVAHILIPTVSYVEAYASQLPTYFPNGIYFTDNEKLYKFVEIRPDVGVVCTEVPIEELVEVNPEGTTIIKETKSTFSLCKLKECYYLLVKKLLKALCGIGGCDAAAKYSQDIFNRDLIWMAINAIRYAIEQGQYFEAQRLLESIQGCGNICSEVFTKQLTGTIGCGCNH